MTKEKRNRPTTGDSPLKMGSLWIQAYRLNPSKPSSQESRGFNHGSVKRVVTSVRVRESYAVIQQPDIPTNRPVDPVPFNIIFPFGVP